MKAITTRGRFLLTLSKALHRPLATARFSTIPEPPPRTNKPQYNNAGKPNKMNQVRAYKADPRISMVIKSNASDNINAEEKERYNK